MKTTIALLSATLMALIVTGCGIPEEDHKKVVDARDRLQKQLTRQKSISAENARKLARLSTELRKVKASMGASLAAKEEALKRRLAELAKAQGAVSELERIKREMEAKRLLDQKLRGAFQAMISAGKLQLVNINGRLVIKMASKILFRSGRAKPTGDGKSALKEIAMILAKIDRHFQVAGHTDNIPVSGRKYKDNWALSGHRATVVVRLLEHYGVPGNKLSAAGFSQFQPVGDNANPDGKALNRRIEITLLPTIPPQTKP